MIDESLDSIKNFLVKKTTTHQVSILNLIHIRYQTKLKVI